MTASWIWTPASGAADSSGWVTSQVVRSLEAKGLLAREVDSSDTRARRLTVTRRGGRLAPRAVAVVERADAEFFGDVDALGVLRTLADFSTPG